MISHICLQVRVLDSATAIASRSIIDTTFSARIFAELRTRSPIDYNLKIDAVVKKYVVVLTILNMYYLTLSGQRKDGLTEDTSQFSMISGLC